VKLFVIHRFKDKNGAKRHLKKSIQGMSASFDLIFLGSSECNNWKDQAIKAISKAEAIIVYNRTSCEQSSNAKWEIEKAQESSLPIIDVGPGDSVSDVCSRLMPLYNMEAEFNACFNLRKNDITLEFYKLMIDSSESLIQRRQRTNAFFMAAMGSLLTIASLLVRSGSPDSIMILLLFGFAACGLLLCYSWRNLIDNYGKLNKAKFDVILRLEKNLDARIYEAEWISLGKGLRPRKYKSFTSTEKDVPLCFGLLIIILMIGAIVWRACAR